MGGCAWSGATIPCPPTSALVLPRAPRSRRFRWAAPTSSEGDLSDAGLHQAALRLGLDAARFEQLSRSPASERRIATDMAAGDAAGIEGTPAVFINDYYLMGARHEAEYALVVQRALREAGS